MSESLTVPRYGTDMKRNRPRVPGSVRDLAARLGKSKSTIARRMARRRSKILTVVIAPQSPQQVRLVVAPATLAEANAIVASIHRHHAPATGHRFSLKVIDEAGAIHGVAIAGRPVAREICQSTVLEVSRVATNGTPNACSALYGAAARTAKAMGFARIQTYTLASESGTSLKAAGWVMDGQTSGGDWNTPKRRGRRTDQPQEPKHRWTR